MSPVACCNCKSLSARRSQEFADGKDYYIRHGAGPFKNKTLLTAHNLVQKAANFHSNVGTAETADSFATCVTEMLKTGKFYLSGAILNRPMCEDRVEAAWHVAMYHALTTVNDTRLILYGNGEADDYRNRGRAASPPPITPQRFATSRQRIRAENEDAFINLAPPGPAPPSP